MEKGFWNNLKKPIIGMAPMDGVTDAPFRYITAKYGRPDLMITEFTSVEGICAGSTKTLGAFSYDESERPIVAQLFGSTPEAFYKATFVACELGFDGVDINMGCPAKNISSKGAGASLILTPELAKKIVRKTRKACKDWASGKTIEASGLPETILEYVKLHKPVKIIRKELPVSIKTRIGYSEIVIEEWINHLLEVEPVNISIHGRTLKQMYTGLADWEAIGKAAKMIKQTPTMVLGNGDIKNIADAYLKIKQYGLDGVLIGRAAFGNPWIFQNKEASLREKLETAKEHSHIHEKLFGQRFFVPMRKHLGWYCKGFAGAGEVRQKLMKACSVDDVETIIDDIEKNLNNAHTVAT